eukprot:GFYU01006530.1.p1 GENE.GFYU01006530.1~~GFYU01006530.1.p1  ORF type:complete len:434 (-),score=165.52 GFYU01006530.1:176-1477(-)
MMNEDETNITVPEGENGAAATIDDAPAETTENFSDLTIAPKPTPPASSSASKDSGIEVFISDPQKHGEGTMHAYISYKVTTQTTLQYFNHSQFHVVRRYRDFVWLHTQLGESYPGVIIPPIPEKILVGRFSTEIIESRRRALETFLNRVGRHPELVESEAFHAFLEKGDDTFEDHKNVVAQRRKSRDLMQGAKELWTQFSNTVVKHKGEVEGDEQLDSMKAYATNLETQIVAAHKHSEKLIKRRRELATGLSEFGLSFTLLGNCESGKLQTALTKLGTVADRLCIMSQEQADNEVQNFEEPLKDYCRIVASFKEASKARANALLTLQTSKNDLESAQQKAAKLRGQPGKEEKLAQAEREIEQAEANVKTMEEKYKTVCNRTNTEMERFQVEKLADFKKMILDFVKLQIEHSEKVQSVWEGLVPEIESIATQNS